MTKKLSQNRPTACHCERSEAISLPHVGLRLLRRCAPRNDMRGCDIVSKLAQRAFARMVAVMMCIGGWSAGAASAAVGIVPLPASIEQRDGSFPITPSTCVVAEGPAAAEASKLIEALAPAMGYRLKPAANVPAKDSMQLKIEPSLRERLGEEGYELEATTDSRRHSCRRAGRALLWHPDPQAIAAAGSVRQAEGRGREVGRAVRVHHGPPALCVARLAHRPGPALHPRAGRRAIHRHDGPAQVQPPASPPDRRPGLADRDQEVPATGPDRRLDGLHDHRPGGQRPSGRRPGGFYTQEDIRHLVRYAAERYVTIVPEIEMPAHTGAAIVSYPQIGLYPHEAERPAGREALDRPRGSPGAASADRRLHAGRADGSDGPFPEPSTSISGATRPISSTGRSARRCRG